MISDSKKYIFYLFLVAQINFSFCWDEDDLVIFDLVEEVNKNFYSFLDLPQDANATAIRKAFRSYSLILHPDKNDAPDAEIQFRNLVAIYDVLKDPVKREKYDQVLQNGLPNWKSAVYYYRHVRKMGLMEMSIILFVVISIGQYIVAWASYFEQKLTMESQRKTKIKKGQKKTMKQNVSKQEPEPEYEILKPSLKNTLPIQIPKLIFTTIVSVPFIIKAILSFIAEEKERRKLKKQQEIEELEEIEEKKLSQEVKYPRRRKPQFVVEERNYEDEGCLLDPVDEPLSKELKPPPISGGFWSDDDLDELIRLVNKHPPGTTDRWERIAEIMNRPAAEITFMAAKIKNLSLKPSPKAQENQTIVVEVPKKVKTKKNVETEVANSAWTQTQQKALESALSKYPKGSVADRWDKISKSVPNKTKEECILRYKYLATIINKQKANNETSENLNENETKTSEEEPINS